RQLARRNFSHAIHGTNQRFSVARTRFEAGRTGSANETPDHFLVDCVGLGPGTFAFAAFASSQKRRSRRSSVAFYKWNDRGTERCRGQSSQRRGKCLAVPAAPRREKKRRYPRVAALLS